MHPSVPTPPPVADHLLEKFCVEDDYDSFYMGCEANADNDENFTPSSGFVVLAIENGRFEIVKYLLRNWGVDLDNLVGLRRAMLTAAMRGYLETLKTFYKHMDHPVFNYPDRNWEEADLMEAAVRSGHLSVLRFFCETEFNNRDYIPPDTDTLLEISDTCKYATISSYLRKNYTVGVPFAPPTKHF